MLNKFSKNNGFTLIELLVVVAIIAILTTLALFTYPNAQKRARDASRKSDLSQYRNALETYANRSSSSLYPVHSTRVAPNSMCASELGLTGACPQDPKNGTGSFGYWYISDTGGTTYLLYAYLESVTTNNYFGLCSNGTSITKTTQPVIADCP